MQKPGQLRNDEAPGCQHFTGFQHLLALESGGLLVRVTTGAGTTERGPPAGVRQEREALPRTLLLLVLG